MAVDSGKVLNRVVLATGERGLIGEPVSLSVQREGIEELCRLIAAAGGGDRPLIAIEGAPDDVGPIVGRDAMRDYIGEWFEMFDDLRLVTEEVTDAGEGQLIALWHMAGTAKASGVPTELRVFVAYTIRDGKIVRGREYMTREEAEASLAR